MDWDAGAPSGSGESDVARMVMEPWIGKDRWSGSGRREDDRRLVGTECDDTESFSDTEAERSGGTSEDWADDNTGRTRGVNPPSETEGDCVAGVAGRDEGVNARKTVVEARGGRVSESEWEPALLKLEDDEDELGEAASRCQLVRCTCRAPHSPLSSSPSQSKSIPERSLSTSTSTARWTRFLSPKLRILRWPPALSR
jgi:hypothetical protein